MHLIFQIWKMKNHKYIRFHSIPVSNHRHMLQHREEGAAATSAREPAKMIGKQKDFILTAQEAQQPAITSFFPHKKSQKRSYTKRAADSSVCDSYIVNDCIHQGVWNEWQNCKGVKCQLYANFGRELQKAGEGSKLLDGDTFYACKICGEFVHDAKASVEGHVRTTHLKQAGASKIEDSIPPMLIYACNNKGEPANPEDMKKSKTKLFYACKACKWLVFTTWKKDHAYRHALNHWHGNALMVCKWLKCIDEAKGTNIVTLKSISLVKRRKYTSNIRANRKLLQIECQNEVAANKEQENQKHEQGKNEGVNRKLEFVQDANRHGGRHGGVCFRTVPNGSIQFPADKKQPFLFSCTLDEQPNFQQLNQLIACTGKRKRQDEEKHRMSPPPPPAQEEVGLLPENIPTGVADVPVLCNLMDAYPPEIPESINTADAETDLNWTSQQQDAEYERAPDWIDELFV